MKLETKKVSGQSALIRPPQRFFNPTLVKSDCKKEKHPGLDKSFYSWCGHLFRNGFLYLPLRIVSLGKPNPTLDEVQRFQQSSRLSGGVDLDDYLSD